MESITGLNIPWRGLANRLVKMTDDGKEVFYRQFPAVILGKDESTTSSQVFQFLKVIIYHLNLDEQQWCDRDLISTQKCS